MNSRREHLENLAATYLKGFSGSVLDVGCDQKDLRDILKPSRYVGLDIGAGREGRCRGNRQGNAGLCQRLSGGMLDSDARRQGCG